MFGFSLTKLLFTLIAVVVIWHGFKWFTRMQEMQGDKRRPVRAQARREAPEPRGQTSDAEDMVACPACRSFVVAQGARNCGRDDCPYPG